MARIPYFKPSATDTEKIKLLGIEPYKLNIFKIAAHATTPIARKFIGLPAAVLTSGKLDPILRELAITRAGILCNSEYEVFQHRKVCKRVGMPEEKIKALDIGSTAPVFPKSNALFCVSLKKPCFSARSVTRPLSPSANIFLMKCWWNWPSRRGVI